MLFLRAGKQITVPCLGASMVAIGVMAPGVVSGQSTAKSTAQSASTRPGQAASAASGRAYPGRPIRILGGPVGGSSDYFSRFVAQGISGALGQPLIVENRSGVISGQLASQAQPDGHTLILAAGSFWVGQIFQKTIPYDPVRDFSPISLLVRSPNVLVVHPSVPIKSVNDLIAYAKAKPDALNASTGANGASSHIALELFKSMTGIDITRVTFSSGSAETAGLLGGQIQMTFGAAVEVSPHIKSGKLRAVAVSSLERSALFPELPTISASGVPGFESGSKTGLFAPAKTSAAIINRLNQEVVRFLQTPEAREQLLGRGVEVVASTPQELGNTVTTEIAKISKLIK